MAKPLDWHRLDLGFLVGATSTIWLIPMVLSVYLGWYWVAAVFLGLCLFQFALSRWLMETA